MPNIIMDNPSFNRCFTWKIMRLIVSVLVLMIAFQVQAKNQCDTGAVSKDDSQIILMCEQQLSETPKSDPEYLTLSLSLANLYQTAGDLSSAERILKSLIHDFPEIPITDKITSLRQLGIIYFTQRQYEQAYNIFEQSLSLMLKHGNKQYIALGYNDLSNVYQAYGDFDAAAKLLLKSYDIHTEVNNQIGRASTLNNLGSLYRDRGDFDEAIVALRRSYSIYLDIDMPLRAALTLANLGDTFQQSGNPDKAIELLKESVEDLQAVNSYHSLAKVYVLLAEVYIKIQKPNEAQEYLRQAKLTWNLIQATADNPKYWFAQAQIWDLLGELDKAWAAFEKAFQLVKQDNEFNFQIKLYEAMAKLSERRNDFKASSQYWHLYAATLENQRSLKNSIKSHQLRSTFSIHSENSVSEYLSDRIVIAIFSALLSIVILYGLTRLKRRYVNRGKGKGNAASVSPQKYSDSTEIVAVSEKSGVAMTESALITSTCVATELSSGTSSSTPLPLANHFVAKQFSEPFAPEKSTVTGRSFSDMAANDVSDAGALGNINSQQSDPKKAGEEYRANTAFESEKYRQQLVEMMHLALQMWEEHMQTGKLELAEKSKIWSVGVDDGRLRARAMERYFSINTLPQKPRWRSVVRTCNYVLRQCNEKSLYRDELEGNLRSFQAIIKRNATIVSKCG